MGYQMWYFPNTIETVHFFTSKNPLFSLGRPLHLNLMLKVDQPQQLAQPGYGIVPWNKIYCTWLFLHWITGHEIYSLITLWILYLSMPNKRTTYGESSNRSHTWPKPGLPHSKSMVANRTSRAPPMSNTSHGWNYWQMKKANKINNTTYQHNTTSKFWALRM